MRPRNGSPAVELYGSPLPTDALRILASLTPAEVRQGFAMVESAYLGNGGDYPSRLGFIRKLQAAVGCLP